MTSLGRRWTGSRHGATVCFFFFSSRRRHTRCSRDWSSDVCSSDLSLFLWRRKPILPTHRAYLPRRSMRERIPRKKQQHIGISAEQTLLCPHHDWLLPPRTQRRKPQIPIEPRLIRRVNPRRLAWVLRLETEGIHEPGLSVVGTLNSIS